MAPSVAFPANLLKKSLHTRAVSKHFYFLAHPEIHQLHAEGERILRYGTFEFHTAGRELHCSEGVYHLLEYPLHARPPMTPEQFLSHLKEGREEPFVTLEETLLGAPFSGEETARVFEAVTYTGNPIWIQIWGKESPDAVQDSGKITGIIRDVTEQYEKDQQAQRTLEDLQQSNRELEEFAYVASHDLQEPLRKISTFCGRLYARYHDQLDREGGQYLDRIMASADSMRNLIQNLLDYSRVTQIEEALQPTRLDVLLIGVQSELELVIEETRADISIDPLPVVMGHAPLLTQLFTNLFSNAIKFRKPNVTPHIRVSVTTPSALELAAAGLDTHEAFYRVRVEDNGIGFDPSQTERIFQLFQRLHGKAEFPGTGIGLAICRKIAERHGGALIAHGEEGRGAHFSIYFPADPMLQV